MTSIATIRVLVVEDQALVRDAVSTLLALDAEISVCGQCIGSNDALQFLQQQQVDVVVTDIEMPGRSGIELAEILSAEFATVKTIIMTTFSRAGYVRRALEAGVQGFVLKDAPSKELVKAIKLAMQGHKVIDPELALMALGSIDPLSEKERCALGLVREGQKVADIALQLSLSEGTVRNYLSSAISKLNAGNSVDAARIAHQKGWL